MTTLTQRMIKDDFVLTGPDIEPKKFKSRRTLFKDVVPRFSG